MKIITYIMAIAFILIAHAFTLDFIMDQKNYSRVRTAYNEKEPILTNRLKKLNLNLENIHILMVAYKDEKELEIFVKSKSDIKYRKLTTYPICKASGQPGPKNRSGDLQVPEGFYSIDRFNPSSIYYLSLGLNYPNQSDRLRSKSTNLGGDIFIHGYCVTIGCLPMTNDQINEIYIYAIQAKHNGQNNIPVYLFPFKLSNENLSSFKEKHKADTKLLAFWDNLKVGYDKFHQDFKELNVKVGLNGKYIIE